MYKGYLYVGGYFSMAGGVQAWSLARWNGTDWEGCGSFDAQVHALLVHDDLLYVAGTFYFIGSTYYGEIAAFDGEEWSSVGGGMNDNVLGLAEYDGKLVAVGAFTNAGGVSARRVALWDGQEWSALGTGIDEYPSCAIEYEGALVVGGTFREAGGEAVRHLAIWDGSSWRSSTRALATLYHPAMSTPCSSRKVGCSWAVSSTLPAAYLPRASLGGTVRPGVLAQAGWMAGSASSPTGRAVSWSGATSRASSTPKLTTSRTWLRRI